jgi:hypothetical protein
MIYYQIFIKIYNFISTKNDYPNNLNQQNCVKKNVLQAHGRWAG